MIAEFNRLIAEVECGSAHLNMKESKMLQAYRQCGATEGYMPTKGQLSVLREIIGRENPDLAENERKMDKIEQKPKKIAKKYRKMKK
jgi:hypothetical protein